MSAWHDLVSCHSQGLDNIFAGNLDLAYLFFELIPQGEDNDFFKLLEDKMPDLYCIVRTSWSLRCFVSKYSSFSPSFSQNLFISDLISLKIPQFNDLKPVINANFSDTPAPKTEFPKFLSALLEFNQKFPNYFAIIYNLFEKVLNQIGITEAFNIIGENSLLLYPNLKADDLKDIRFNMISPMSTLILFKNEEVTHYLQNTFIQSYQFSTPSPGLSKDITASLTNTSLYLNAHFIDLIYNSAAEGFISDNFSQYQVSSQIIPSFSHLITVSFYNKMMENPSKYKLYFQNDVNDIWGSGLYMRAKMISLSFKCVQI